MPNIADRLKVSPSKREYGLSLGVRELELHSQPSSGFGLRRGFCTGVLGRVGRDHRGRARVEHEGVLQCDELPLGGP